MKPVDLSGTIVGDLEILIKVGSFETGKTGKKYSTYACKCKCGNIVTKNSQQLKKCSNKSCKNCKRPKKLNGDSNEL